MSRIVQNKNDHGKPPPKKRVSEVSATERAFIKNSMYIYIYNYINIHTFTCVFWSTELYTVFPCYISIYFLSQPSMPRIPGGKYLSRKRFSFICHAEAGDPPCFSGPGNDDNGLEPSRLRPPSVAREKNMAGCLTLAGWDMVGGKNPWNAHHLGVHHRAFDEKHQKTLGPTARQNIFLGGFSCSYPI